MLATDIYKYTNRSGMELDSLIGVITGAISAIYAAIVAPNPRVCQPAEGAIGEVVPG